MSPGYNRCLLRDLGLTDDEITRSGGRSTNQSHADIASNTYGHVKNCLPNSDEIDGLVQDCSNSIANALELLQSCTNQLKYASP